MTDLSGQHAWVSGGGTGVGAAIALTLAEAGAQVTILGRRERPLVEQASRHDRIDWRVCDVTDGAAVAAARAAAAARAGPITIAVANAGAADSKPFKAMTPADMQAALDVNLMGVFNLFHASLSDMTAQGGGRMIAVASTAGLRGYPYVSGYVAAKHAVVGLCRGLALDLAKDAITVNAICPGFVETPMLRRSIDVIMDKTGKTEAEARRALQSGNPQRRFIQTDEVAGAALWLCSAAARSVNGHALSVSGGEI